MHAKAILIDVEDNFAILGYAKPEEDGLFYMEDFHKLVPKFDSKCNSVARK